MRQLLPCCLKRFAWLCLGLGIISVVPVQSTVDIFLKLGDIQGESQDKTRGGECAVLAWCWGMRQPRVGFGGGGRSGKVSFSSVTVTKWMGTATPKLMEYWGNGKHI